ncbi:Neural proliferation differentiation like protein [Argiope bruennichi]|uniref:Neural proliferation differentiation like protein n=1 Tax=Argiope bruennichi TaxID=94029 RepID=A0A8T0EEA4_ARGBR|nr:Neural proliferation differentiation like protein [Argiope bruennichi]
MKLLWFMLCLTSYSCLANSQENDEAAVLQKDLQDFVRRLSQQQLHTTQNMRSPLLSQMHYPLSRPPFEPNEDLISSPSGFNFPFQSRNDGREGARSFASSFSSVKRPHDSGEVRSEAVAYASVNDVNKEEHLGEDMAIVAGCCAVGIFGVISAGVCFYRAGSTKNTSASDVDSEEENEEGDYTVYECPGLAPTGEMEVKNPLFHDDSTPVSPPLPAKSDDIHHN